MKGGLGGASRKSRAFHRHASRVRLHPSAKIKEATKKKESPWGKGLLNAALDGGRPPARVGRIVGIIRRAPPRGGGERSSRRHFRKNLTEGKAKKKSISSSERSDAVGEGTGLTKSLP